MNLQNNNNQVTLPRRSRRLATIIPASYWISIGYSEADAELMEQLQNDIKKYCDGGDANNDEIYLKGRHEIGLTLSHHDIMLPHWKKLAKALEKRTNMTEVVISGISLPLPVLDIIFPALQSTNLENLVLSAASLHSDGSAGYQRLTSFLRENTSLKEIFLWDVIDNMSVATSLSGAIKNHPTLEKLMLLGGGLNEIPALETILNGCTELNHLGFVLNHLGSEAVTLLADFISSNHPVEAIDLERNNITNSDANLLALALKKNTNLKWLDLNKNDITEEGEKALLKVMFDKTSIDSIVESNHGCSVYTYDTNDDPSLITVQRGLLEQEVLKINRGEYSIKEKIRMKVVLALCGVDGGFFDLSHFNDIPLQLMPRVLELVQEHSQSRKGARVMPIQSLLAMLEESPSFDFVQHFRIQLEIDALSRLFHILRGWELPSLFVNLNNAAAIVSTRKRKRRKTRR